MFWFSVCLVLVVQPLERDGLFDKLASDRILVLDCLPGVARAMVCVMDAELMDLLEKVDPIRGPNLVASLTPIIFHFL